MSWFKNIFTQDENEMLHATTLPSIRTHGSLELSFKDLCNPENFLAHTIKTAEAETLSLLKQNANPALRIALITARLRQHAGKYIVEFLGDIPKGAKLMTPSVGPYQSW